MDGGELESGNNGIHDIIVTLAGRHALISSQICAAEELVKEKENNACQIVMVHTSVNRCYVSSIGR